jgi:MATE family multidrug resistance protein
MIILDFYISLKAEGEFKDLWIGWAKSSLEGLGTFLEYAIPSVVLECSNWWALEIIVLLSGYHLLSGQYSPESFSAQVVIMNIFTLIYVCPLGISYTVSALVGNNIGVPNQYKLAIRFAKIGYFYGLLSIIVICMFL